MTDRVLLFLQPTVTGDYRWVVSGMDGSASRAEQGGLELAAARARGNRVTALVSAREVLLTRANLPSHNRQRLRQAIPYALEEQLAAEVDELHFALGSRDENGSVAVAVVDRERLSEGLERLRQAGIVCESVVPEPLALPREGRQWTIWVDAERAVVRTGEVDGFETETNSLEAILRLAWEAATEKPDKVVLIGVGDLDVPQWEQTELSVRRHGNDLDVLTELARAVAGKRVVLNLLQGEFSARERAGQLLRPWWPVVIVLALILFIKFVSVGVENRQMASRIAAMDEEVLSLYRAVFPDARNIVDPRVQMKRGLEKLRAGNASGPRGFLGLVAGAAPILGTQAGLKLQGISYRDERLDIDLQIGDLQALDRLKQQLLKAGGLQVDIVTARSREAGVDARIRLQEAAP